MLLASLTDALAKQNSFSKGFFQISFMLGCFSHESSIRFAISLSVNDGSITPSFEGNLPEVF